MATKGKTNLRKLVEDAEGENPKNRISTLEVHSVEPVIEPQDKRNKAKGRTKNERKKPDRKTDKRAIKKGEEKTDKGKEAPVPVPDRGSDNGFKGYAW